MNKEYTYTNTTVVNACGEVVNEIIVTNDITIIAALIQANTNIVDEVGLRRTIKEIQNGKTITVPHTNGNVSTFRLTTNDDRALHDALENNILTEHI